MNKRFFISLACMTALIVLIISCEKDFKESTVAPAPPPASKSYTESFDSVANIAKKGWIILNNSVPVGPMGWRQGRYELGGKLGDELVGFPAHSSTFNQNEYVSVDLNCGQGEATLSAWLITPITELKNGDEISFYSRSKGDYIDRMQVWLNTQNSEPYAGKAALDTGYFNVRILDINEGMAFDYPVEWTKYTLTIKDIKGNDPIKGRIGFRYFVIDGGPSGANGDQIGIDDFVFTSK